MKHLVTLVGLLILAIVVWLTGPAEIAAALAGTNFFVVLALLSVLLSYFVQSLRFRMLLHSKLGIIDSFNLVASASVANLVAPMGGGDVMARPFLAKKILGKSQHEAFAVVLVERIFDFCGILLISAYFALGFSKSLSLLLLFGVIGVIAAYLVLSRIRGPGFLRKYSIELAKTRSWTLQTFLRTGAYTVLNIATIAMTLYILALSLGVSQEAVGLYFISAVAGIVTLIPGGLGVTDGAAAALFAAQGLDPATGVTMALIMRILGIAAAALSFLMLSNR